MERRRRIPGPDGEPVNVTEIGFRDHNERWNEYLLDDGTVIRLKLVVLRVYRWDGHFDHRGDPVYFVDSAEVIAASPLESEE